MAIKKVIEVEVQLGKSEQNISKINNSFDKISNSVQQAKETTKAFGLENEGVSQTLSKVQENTEKLATAYRTSVSVLKSLGIIQKISTAAQWLWNAAMAANPIGAIVAVIVALIAVGYALVRMFISSSEAAEKSAIANKKLNAELQQQIKLQEKANEQLQLSRDAQYAMAKATGASSKELRKLSEELANQEVAQKRANAETLRAIFIEARRVAGLENSTDTEKETAKVAYKAFQDANKTYESAILDRKKLAIKNRVEIRQEETDANKKSQEDAKKANDELTEKAKKKAADLLEIEKARLKAVADLELNFLKQSQDLNAKTEQEKLDLQKQRELEEINQLAKTQNEKLNLLALFNEKYATLQTELDEKNTKEKAVKDLQVNQKKAESDDANWVRLQELTMERNDYEKLVLQQKLDANLIAAGTNEELIGALKNKYVEDANAIDEKAKEDRIAKEKAVLDAKLDFGIQSLNLISELAGKGSKIGKAIAIAQTIRSGIEGVQSAYTTAQKSPITIGFPGYPLLQAGIAGAFSAIQVAKIAATKDTGGSAPSGVGGGANGGGGGSPAPPQFNTVGQSSTNQLSQTIAGQQNRPIQTYVVGNQVTNQQSLDRNAAQTSSFG